MPMDSCGMMLKQISDIIGKRANNIMREDGVTLSQTGAMSFLGDHGGSATFKQVEKALMVSQPTTVGILSRLQKKGLIRTYYSHDDQRVKIAELTEKGRKSFAKARGNMEKEEKKMLSPLSKDEQKVFLEMLARVRDAVSRDD